jgi:hypothetical protein
VAASTTKSTNLVDRGDGYTIPERVQSRKRCGEGAGKGAERVPKRCGEGARRKEKNTSPPGAPTPVFGASAATSFMTSASVMAL